MESCKGIREVQDNNNNKKKYEGNKKKHEENLGDERGVHYFDCGDAFTGVDMCQKSPNCVL